MFLFLGTHFLLIRKGNRNLECVLGGQSSTTSVHCIVYYYVIAEQQRGELQQGEEEASSRAKLQNVHFVLLFSPLAILLLWQLLCSLYSIYYCSQENRKPISFHFRLNAVLAPLYAYLTCSLFIPILFWPLLGPFLQGPF